MINQEREIEREKRDRGHIHNMIYTIYVQDGIWLVPLSTRLPQSVHPVWSLEYVLNQLNSAFRLSNLHILILYSRRKKN